MNGRHGGARDLWQAAEHQAGGFATGVGVDHREDRSERGRGLHVDDFSAEQLADLDGCGTESQSGGTDLLCPSR